MKIDFNNEQVFHQFEEDAIDGSLIYDDFPPCEYKYFSKLSKLGYNNRHKGWSVKICEEKKKELKHQYLSEKEKFDRFFSMACKMQNNIRKGEAMICKVNKANTKEEKLKCALMAIELMICQDGYAERTEVQE